MSVNGIVHLANRIAMGEMGVRFPCMKFSDFSLLCRCINEAKANG